MKKVKLPSEFYVISGSIASGLLKRPQQETIEYHLPLLTKLPKSMGILTNLHRDKEIDNGN